MAFEALGYYDRYISHEETGEVLMIRIRRFRSLGCEVTVSCLPDFCQPYRIVCNAGIADYFAGDHKQRRVIGWHDVLGSYRRRWACWIKGKVAGMGPGLLAMMGARFGRPPPPGKGLPGELWRQLMAACGGVDSATRQLLREFGVTLFGRYKCHQSRCASHGKG
jgi:hypothetical protein